MIFHQVSPEVPHLVNVHGVSHEAPRVTYHEPVNLLASFHALSPVLPSPAPAPSPVVLSLVASSPVASSPVVPSPSPSPSLVVPFLGLPSPYPYLAALFLGVLSVVLPPENARMFFH